MFTGIIEEKGTVESVRHGAKSCRLTIRADKIFDGLSLGDSVAVNGVCLTADEISPPNFTADVMAETMRKTTLNSLVKGSSVNLERALRLCDRLGGHIVSGHVDGVGTIVNMTREDNAVWVTITASEEIMRHIVKKGSVALDGISLTVADTGKSTFSVSLIPHTMRETTITDKRVGGKINIECDVIGKYVEKLLQKDGGGITEDFLRGCGF